MAGSSDDTSGVAALEAAQRMCSARTGVDLAREYQEGVSDAFQR